MSARYEHLQEIQTIFTSLQSISCSQALTESVFRFFHFDVVSGGGFDGGFQLVSKSITVGGGDDNFAEETAIPSYHQFAMLESKGAYPEFGSKSSPFGDGGHIFQSKAPNRQAQTVNHQMS